MQGIEPVFADLEAIRFGTVTTESQGGPSTAERTGIPLGPFEAFCEAFEPSLGLKVIPCVFPDYRALLEAMVRGQVDIAWLPPVVALKSATEGATTPLVYPARGGVSFYSSALFSRRDSGIANPVDLVRLRAAWVDPQSAAGYLIIRAWLLSQRIDPSVAFCSNEFLGSHEAVVQAVLSGKADVGASYAHVDPTTHVVYAAAWGRSAVQIIALAGPIPADVIAASTRLPEHVLAKLQSCLVHNEDRRFLATCKTLLNARGFEPASLEHIAPLQGLLSHLERPTLGWRSIPPPPMPPRGEE